MTDAPVPTTPKAPQRLARWWPLGVILALQVTSLAISQTPSINNFVRFGHMMLGPLVCGVLGLVWLFAGSRLGWREGLAILGALGLLGGAVVASVHPTMGVYSWAYGVPVGLLALAIGVGLARRGPSVRRVGLVAGLAALGLAPFPLLRNDGVDGAYRPALAWRWNPTAEERLLAAETSPVAGADSVAWEATSAEWPGFRGPLRDSVVKGGPLSIDWKATPPREVWRRAIGPGWGSFAYVAGRLFTQEQRGDAEAVTCYDAATGEPVWRHDETTRFSDVVSGAGPRATPAYANGRVFALGANGLLAAVDASTGKLIWKRDFKAEWNAPVPQWGFSGSPLVLGERVFAYAGGDGDHGLVALDAATGKDLWGFETRGMNFSSPQRAEIDGVEMVLFADDRGLHGLDPETGKALWKFDFPEGSAAPMVQPQQVGPSSVVVALGDNIGLARVEVERKDGAWASSLGWSSKEFKPSFNDFVCHEGFLYGFDQNLFACVELESGKRRWKRGRYGFGQAVLLGDAGKILVTSETGEAVLVDASPTKLVESGRTQAIAGKTWNHPVVVGERLYVRNGDGMACFEIGEGGGGLQVAVYDASR